MDLLFSDSARSHAFGVYGIALGLAGAAGFALGGILVSLDLAGAFVNGTRLVYPMENEAMRPLNFIANRCFAYLFSYLVNTRLTDTLCGTKVLLRRDYEMLAKERSYFGNFDPFGDFDLIFGAAKQNLKIIETPIHYKARTFGETQISRFHDGWLLLKMVWFAYRKLKAI